MVMILVLIYSPPTSRLPRQPVSSQKNDGRCRQEHGRLPLSTQHPTNRSPKQCIPLPPSWPSKRHALPHRSRASATASSEQSVQRFWTSGSCGRGRCSSGCCDGNCNRYGNCHSVATRSWWRYSTSSFRNHSTRLYLSRYPLRSFQESAGETWRFLADCEGFESRQPVRENKLLEGNFPDEELATSRCLIRVQAAEARDLYSFSS